MQAGLITLRNSANQRRCSHRNDASMVGWAYGIDLKPILERLDDLKTLAVTIGSTRHKMH
ncbi:MAG: hypothetical protein HRT36_03265 [Alphaproteobacteria bacterium]|nr:hypothetical protein [Alphaproteobacteria bacterium]